VKTAEERSKSKRMEVEARQRKVDHMQQFVDKWRCNANRAKLVQSRIKAINRLEDEFEVDDFGVVVRQEAEEDVDLERRVRFDFPVPEDVRSANMKVSFSDVDFSYDDGSNNTPKNNTSSRFFANLNFGLHSGSKVVLVGSNGAGKSTLLNLISGKLRPNAGVVERSPKLRIATFSQHHVDGIDLSLTPLEYFLSTIDNVSRADEERVRAHLSSFGIDRELSEQAGWTLSGGQKSRIGLARICWDRPHFLLLDEPSNHLDMESIDGLLEGLLAFSAKGGGLLMVSHDEYLIEGLLNEGAVDGTGGGKGELWSVELAKVGGGSRDGVSPPRVVRVLDPDFGKYKREIFM
jgi:ATP-binding cassette subfamily F protein 3